MEILKHIITILLGIVFVLINVRISYEDFRFKKIKNKYILFLILLFVIYYVLYPFNISKGLIINFLIIFIPLIGLYLFDIIPAGDVKYIMTLSLFANKDISIFFAFVSIVILIKIGINYLIFLLEKIYFRNYSIKSFEYSKIISFFTGFLSIYFVMNIVSYYIFSNFPNVHNSLLYKILYTSLTILLIFMVKKYYNLVIQKLDKETIIFKILNHIEYPIIVLFFIINIIFYQNLLIQFSINGILKVIFYMLGISFFLKSFSLMLTQNDEKYINIYDLKVGDSVDTNFLNEIYGKYKSVIDYLMSHKIIDDKAFFEGIPTPIDEKNKNKIINIYETINKRNIEEENGYTIFNKIKIYKTFGFGIYIFLGFISLVLYKLFFFFNL